VIIDRVTLWQAASHASALKMVLVGVALVLPFLLGYTVFAHRVFRGKTQVPLYE
jgi:cytochrome d ubiquinol oxidase subunit II